MFKINLIIIVLLQDITYADYSGIGPYSVEATTSMVTPSGNISTQLRFRKLLLKGTGVVP